MILKMVYIIVFLVGKIKNKGDIEMDIQTNEISLSDRITACKYLKVEEGMEIEVLVGPHTISGIFLCKRTTGDLLLLCGDAVRLIYADEILSWSIYHDDMDKILTSSESIEKAKKEELQSENFKRQELRSDPLYMKVLSKYSIDHTEGWCHIVKKGLLSRTRVHSLPSPFKSTEVNLKNIFNQVVFEEYQKEKVVKMLLFM